MNTLLKLRALHEAWHMVAIDYVFGDKVNWRRVWVTPDPIAPVGGLIDAYLGNGGSTLRDSVASLDAQTKRDFYVVLRAARWGTAKVFGQLVADAHAIGDMAQERLLALSEEDTGAALAFLEDAALDGRAACIAGMLESQLEFTAADCVDALRASKLSATEREAEKQQVLDTLARIVQSAQHIKSSLGQ